MAVSVAFINLLILLFSGLILLFRASETRDPVSKILGLQVSCVGTIKQVVADLVQAYERDEMQYCGLCGVYDLSYSTTPTAPTNRDSFDR